MANLWKYTQDAIKSMVSDWPRAPDEELNVARQNYLIHLKQMQEIQKALEKHVQSFTGVSGGMMTVADKLKDFFGADDEYQIYSAKFHTNALAFDCGLTEYFRKIETVCTQIKAHVDNLQASKKVQLKDHDDLLDKYMKAQSALDSLKNRNRAKQSEDKILEAEQRLEIAKQAYEYVAADLKNQLRYMLQNRFYQFYPLYRLLLGAQHEMFQAFLDQSESLMAVAPFPEPPNFTESNPPAAPSRKKSDIGAPPVFGVDPLCLPSIEDKGYKVPVVLVQLKRALEDVQALREEGLFRLAGCESELEAMKTELAAMSPTNEELNSGILKKPTSPSFLNPHNVATLIKRWFKELPVRVLHNEVTELLKRDPTGTLTEQQMREFPQTLPEPKRSLFCWLRTLLVEIATNVATSKMDPKNLAIVIGPTLVGDSTADSNPFVSLNQAKVGVSIVCFQITYGLSLPNI